MANTYYIKKYGRGWMAKVEYPDYGYDLEFCFTYRGAIRWLRKQDRVTSSSNYTQVNPVKSANVT